MRIAQMEAAKNSMWSGYPTHRYSVKFPRRLNVQEHLTCMECDITYLNIKEASWENGCWGYAAAMRERRWNTAAMSTVIWRNTMRRLPLKRPQRLWNSSESIGWSKQNRRKGARRAVENLLVLSYYQSLAGISGS